MLQRALVLLTLVVVGVVTCSAPQATPTATSGIAFRERPWDPPTAIDRERAIAIARQHVTGVPSAVSAVFGNYFDGSTDIPSWLVRLDGVTPLYAPSPSTTGPRVTRVVVDAQRGIVIRLSSAAG